MSGTDLRHCVVRPLSAIPYGSLAESEKLGEAILAVGCRRFEEDWLYKGEMLRELNAGGCSTVDDAGCVVVPGDGLPVLMQGYGSCLPVLMWRGGCTRRLSEISVVCSRDEPAAIHTFRKGASPKGAARGRGAMPRNTSAGSYQPGPSGARMH
eukprot:2978149-Rhodomonas_salina.2